MALVTAGLVLAARAAPRLWPAAAAVMVGVVAYVVVASHVYGRHSVAALIIAPAAAAVTCVPWQAWRVLRARKGKA